MYQKSKPIEDSDYIDYIKSLPCVVCGRTPDPHHVRVAGECGGSQKPSDYWCVPLCRYCHVELGNRGETIFWEQNAIDIKIKIIKLLAAYIAK